MAPRTGRNMPSLPKIIDYWAADRHSDAFPNLAARAIGWGEPFCFRCGWLSPIPEDVLSEPPAKPVDPWKYANGWLQRAHLAERFEGGADRVDNLVPMCSLCHRQMPEQFKEREPAIAWINAWDPDSRNPFWQLATDFAFGGERYRAFPGTGNFLNLRLRADDYHRRALVKVREFTEAA